MAIHNAAQLLPQLPTALEGLLGIGNVIVDQVSKSKTGNALSSLFHGRAPTAHQFVSAARELQKAVVVIQPEIALLTANSKTKDISVKELCELALKSAPNIEAYYQILAQQASHCKWPDNHLLPCSTAFASPQLQVKKSFHFVDGITGIVVVPTDRGSTITPLIVFRGTDAANIHNVIDDFNPEIAALNCGTYKEELRLLIETLAIDSGKRVHLIGHSYGGAVAQQLTSRYPQFVGRCTSHGAPKPGRETVARYHTNINSLTCLGVPAPEVYSYQHAKDLVPYLGTQALPTSPGRNYSIGSIHDKCTSIEAHSLNTLSIPAMPIMVNAPVDRGVRNMASFIEECRQSASKVIPLYKAIKAIAS